MHVDLFEGFCGIRKQLTLLARHLFAFFTTEQRKAGLIGRTTADIDFTVIAQSPEDDAEALAGLGSQLHSQIQTLRTTRRIAIYALQLLWADLSAPVALRGDAEIPHLPTRLGIYSDMISFRRVKRSPD